MGAYSRRNCPDCGADSVELLLFHVRRKRRVTCNQCGSKLEIVVPAAVYNLVTWTSAILGTMLVPFLLLFMFAKEWATLVLAIALLFALIFGSNVLLNRRATVQRAPEPDSNPSALRRWFTD
jgi:uncharacterized protein (DUF983 family)